MSNKKLNALGAALLAGAALGSAAAADGSPAYVGADVGTQFDSKHGTLVRAYAGYNLGSSVAFDLQQLHAVELMVFTLGTRSPLHEYMGGYYGDNEVRASGIGVNWTTALRLNENWSLTSRLGGNYAWANTRYRYVGGNDTYARGGVTAGLGVAYKLNPQVSLTVDLTYMPIRLNQYEKNKAPTLGTGLRYNF